MAMVAGQEMNLLDPFDERVSFKVPKVEPGTITTPSKKKKQKNNTNKKKGKSSYQIVMGLRETEERWHQ